MDGVIEDHRASPAEPDDPVSWRRRGKGHCPPSGRINPPLYLIRIEPANEGARGIHGEAVGVKGAGMSGKEIWRDGNEAIGRELVGDATDPGAEPEDLVHDDDDGRIRAALGIDHPCADAVI